MTISELDLPSAQAVNLRPEGGLSGVVWRWPAADLSLLLVHDIGRDLDALRWITDPLVAIGVSCLAIDLPGHGLSDGDVEADGRAAIATAYGELTATTSGVVAILAAGAAVPLVLSTELADAPVAAVFLAPRRAADQTPPTVGWRLVPKLAIVEAEAEDGRDFANEIIETTNAWCLRADLRSERGAEDDVFVEQVASLALKFLLEQAAFAIAGRAQTAGEQ
jgi:hypothetical protein